MRMQFSLRSVLMSVAIAAIVAALAVTYYQRSTTTSIADAVAMFNSQTETLGFERQPLTVEEVIAALDRARSGAAADAHDKHICSQIIRTRRLPATRHALGLSKLGMSADGKVYSLWNITLDIGLADNKVRRYLVRESSPQLIGVRRVVE